MHMKKTVICFALLMALPAYAAEQAGGARQKEVERRGTQVMPFDQAKTMHFFIKEKDGGVQRVFVKDQNDYKQIKLIQDHMMQIAAKFARRDFSDPEKIHEEENSPVEFRTYPSTWVDLKQKRGETESGYFNGEIILLGEKNYVPTPYNTTLFNVVETMAGKGMEPGLYTIEELAHLVEQRRLKLYDN